MTSLKSGVKLTLMKKPKIKNLGWGTKMKKGLVLRGDLSFGDGTKYSGALKSYKKQIPHGYGIYFFPKHGEMYKEEGIELARIKYYSGNFRNGKFHGQGSFSGTGEYKYKGEFKNGKLHGKGIIKYWKNNESFEGYFKNDRKLSGKWKFPSGDQYEGPIKNDSANGYGKSIYKKSGAKYIGEFKNGAWDGKGKQIQKNGSVYIGKFKNGKRHGYGVVTHKKTYYKGQWIKGLRTGTGIFNFGDGGIYKGQWKNDTMHGKGVLTESKGKTAGQVYSGQWKNGVMDGIFISKDKTGKKRKELWREDKFIKLI